MPVAYANIDEQYAKDKNLKKSDVAAIMEWQSLQPHLPTITELDTILFLYSCFYSNEATKQCIDNNYTCRTHCPEFFAKRNPANKDVQLALDTSVLTVLPKLTPLGYAVTYARLINRNPDVYNFNASLKAFDMLGSLYLREHGCINGHVLVIDLEGATLTHVLKSGVMSVKKYLYYLQDALPVRLKSFHFVNAVPFMDKILALVKPFIKKELQQQLYVHYGDNASIYPHVPKCCLPTECADGDCGPIIEIHNASRKRIEANADYFRAEEQLLVDETQRPGKPKNAGDLFGVEGTFKKLDID